MADYKLRIDIDEAELTKKLKKAVEKAGLAGFSGGGGGGGFSKMVESVDEHTKKLNEEIRATEEIMKTKHKYNILLQKEMYTRQITMKLEARKNELLRRSGVYGRVGSTIGGLVGGRPGAAVGGVFDQLTAMFKYSKGVDKIKKQELANLEKAKNENTIDMDEYIKKKAEIEGLDGDEKKARPMKLVAIGAGLLAGAGISKMIIDSSPLLQSMLKILNVGIMLILRPIGDFVGFLLRPMLIEFVKKVAIPAYKGGFKLAKQWGDSLGKGLLGLLQLIADPIGAVTASIYGGLMAFFGQKPPNTNMLSGMTYEDFKPESGPCGPGITPIEFIGAEEREYTGIGQGGPTFQELMFQPLMAFLGKMNEWFADKGTTLLDDALKSMGTFFNKLSAIFNGMKEVPGFLQALFDDLYIKFTQFIDDIVTRITAFRQIISNMVDSWTKSAGKMWGRISTFFTRTIPDAFQTLADDIVKALKSIPGKMAGWIREAFERVLFNQNPLNEAIEKGTKTAGTKAGGGGMNLWDQILKGLGLKGTTSIGTPRALNMDDILNMIKSGIKGGIRNIGPQMGLEMLYWQYGEPYLRENIPGYDEYAGAREKESDKNWDIMVKGLTELFGGTTKTSAPGSCSFMAHACTGELVSDTFEEVEENSGNILDSFINTSDLSADVLYNMHNIKDYADISRTDMDSTKKSFSDIEVTAISVLTMMAAFKRKVEEILYKAKIKAHTGNATSEQKGLQGLPEDPNISAGPISELQKYRIVWKGGESSIQCLSPAAVNWYKSRPNQVSLYKMARGGIINEPILGFGQETGRHYLMGEAGPETITPGANTKPGISGGNTFNITINAKDVGDIERQLKPTILRILKESTSRAGIV
jgi:hypothetical protein